MSWDNTREEMVEVRKRFPIPCRVVRKKGVKRNETNSLETADIIDVVATGIHRDVFLKADTFMSCYLNPDDYEIVE